VAIRGVVPISPGLKGTLRDARARLARNDVAMMGWLPRDMQLQIPERHLGLVRGEQVDSDALIGANGGGGGARFDVSGIVAVARTAVSGTAATGSPRAVRAAAHHRRPDQIVVANARRSAPRPVLAVARDEAFCFYYPENLELLIEEGADS